MNSSLLGFWAVAGGQVRQETATRAGGLQVPRRGAAGPTDGGFVGFSSDGIWEVTKS